MTFHRDLVPPTQLNLGDSLFSATSAFQLILQEDGNLVLYVIDDGSLPKVGLAGAKYTKAIWASGTNGQGVTHCIMQGDGNLVLYAADGSSRWNSHTEHNPGAFLRCQDDGNLVVYATNGTAPWSSYTQAGSRGSFGQQLTEAGGGGGAGGLVPAVPPFTEPGGGSPGGPV